MMICQGVRETFLGIGDQELGKQSPTHEASRPVSTIKPSPLFEFALGKN